MVELLFLLLPLAFLSGWQTSKRRCKQAQTQKRQLSDNFVKGINYLLNEEPDKALQVFLSHPEIDEYTAETYLLLGNMFRHRGEVDRALRVHQNLIGRSNLGKEKKVAAMLSYGEDFFAAGMLDRAEGVFQELIKDNTGDVQACVTLRSIYEQLQDWDKAIEVAHCAAKKTGNDHSRLIAHYYCELAEQELEKGNIHLVEQKLQQAYKEHKKSNRVMILQGDLELRRNAYSAACKKFQTVIVNDSRLIGTLDQRLTECVEKSGEREQFRQFLLKQLDKTNDPRILEYLVSHVIRFGSNDNLLHTLEEKLREVSPSVVALLGIVKLRSEHSTKAIVAGGYGLIEETLERYLTGIAEFQCDHCGYKMQSFLWRCPACHHWDSVTKA